MTLKLEREAIMPRLSGIKKNLAKLRGLGTLSLEKFSDPQGDSFDLAQHHLRLALEGVFHIGSHILSRLPGGRGVEYKEIATKLGELGVVDREFAKNKLVPMAGMRTLLVHHYADVDPARVYAVIKTHLDDIEMFLNAVAELIENPGRLGLEVE